MIVDDTRARHPFHLLDSPLCEISHERVRDSVDVVIAEERNQMTFQCLNVGLVSRLALIRFLRFFHASDRKLCDGAESLADDGQIIALTEPRIRDDIDSFTLRLSQLFALRRRSLPLAIRFVANMPMWCQRSLEKRCFAFENMNCVIAFLWHLSQSERVKSDVFSLYSDSGFCATTVQREKMLKK